MTNPDPLVTPVVGGTPGGDLRLMVRHRLRLIRQSIEIRRSEATDANSYAFIHREALRDIDILVKQLHDELEAALVPRPVLYPCGCRATVGASGDVPRDCPIHNQCEPESVERSRLHSLVDYADLWLMHAENRAVGWGNMPSIPIGLVRQMRDELAAVLVPRPEPREPEPPIVTPICTFCARGLPGFFLQSGTGNVWHRNEAGQLFKCIGGPAAAVRPASARNSPPANASKESPPVGMAATGVPQTNSYAGLAQDRAPGSNALLAPEVGQGRAAHPASNLTASAPSRPLEEQEEPEDVALKVEVIREYDGRFAASWERGNEGGMAAYSGTVVGALAELCASLIRVDEDNAHAPLRVLVPGGDPRLEK